MVRAFQLWSRIRNITVHMLTLRRAVYILLGIYPKQAITILIGIGIPSLYQKIGTEPNRVHKKIIGQPPIKMEQAIIQLLITVVASIIHNASGKIIEYQPLTGQLSGYSLLSKSINQLQIHTPLLQTNKSGLILLYTIDHSKNQIVYKTLLC